jgi:hypothetical protein
MKQQELENEIAALVDAEIGAGKPIAATWLTHAVVASHGEIPDDGSGYHELCTYAHTRDSVRRVLRRYEVKEEGPDPQVALPGFERLQTAYLVTRDKEQVIVPIDQLTDVEIDAKCTELDAMAKGCLQHADELRRYKAARAEAAAE